MNTPRVAEQAGDGPPCLPDIQPCANEGLCRTLTGIVTVAPVVFLAIAIWQAWNEDLHWYDLVVFAITYVPIGLGVTIGFHRHLTHRSFIMRSRRTNVQARSDLCIAARPCRPEENHATRTNPRPRRG